VRFEAPLVPLHIADLFVFCFGIIGLFKSPLTKTSVLVVRLSEWIARQAGREFSPTTLVESNRSLIG